MNTHYKVSGGPMIVTFHSNTLFSSIKPAENPSTGFLHRSTKSINKKKSTVKSVKKKNRKNLKKVEIGVGLLTSQLLLQEETSLRSGH